MVMGASSAAVVVETAVVVTATASAITGADGGITSGNVMGLMPVFGCSFSDMVASFPVDDNDPWSPLVRMWFEPCWVCSNTVAIKKRIQKMKRTPTAYPTVYHAPAVTTPRPLFVPVENDKTSRPSAVLVYNRRLILTITECSTKRGEINADTLALLAILVCCDWINCSTDYHHHPPSLVGGEGRAAVGAFILVFLSGSFLGSSGRGIRLNL